MLKHCFFNENSADPEQMVIWPGCALFAVHSCLNINPGPAEPRYAPPLQTV